MNAKQLFFIACVTTNIFFTVQSSDDDITRKYEQNKIILIEDNNTAAQQLESIVAKNNKVVVDFFATWCGPCKQFEPVIEQAAKTHTDVIFVKIDIDKCKNLTEAYKVKGMPTLVYFKDGKKVHQAPGAKDKVALNNEIKKRLN